MGHCRFHKKQKKGVEFWDIKKFDDRSAARGLFWRFLVEASGLVWLTVHTRHTPDTALESSKESRDAEERYCAVVCLLFEKRSRPLVIQQRNPRKEYCAYCGRRGFPPGALDTSSSGVHCRSVGPLRYRCKGVCCGKKSSVLYGTSTRFLTMDPGKSHRLEKCDVFCAHGDTSRSRQERQRTGVDCE